MDTRQQARFAKCCSDAGIGYANATLAAYAAWSEQVFGLCAAATRKLHETESTAADTWFKPPTRQPRSTYFAGACAGTTWPMTPFDWMRVGGWSATPDRNPMVACMSWWNPFVPQPSPMVWPMAAMMMSAGVPQTVAWPVAEANAAALDAAEIATKALAETYASHHSASGHASSHTTFAPMKAFAMMTAVPVSTTAYWPWASLRFA